MDVRLYLLTVSRNLGLSAWSDTWSDAFPVLAGVPGERWGIALEPSSSAAETYRAILLSFGSDLVGQRTHQPMLDSYAALRALETTVRLAKLAGPQVAMNRTLDQVPRLAGDGSIDVAPVLWASDSAALWVSGGWDLELLPAGRVGHAQTTGTFWMWGVPAGAPSVDSARRFVQLMTSVGVQSRLWSDAGLLPAHRAAINGAWDPGGEALKALTLRALDRTRFRPQLRSFRTLMEIAGKMVSDTIAAGDGVRAARGAREPADARRTCPGGRAVGDYGAFRGIPSWVKIWCAFSRWRFPSRIEMV